jgi:hypothetical protein
VKSVLPVEDAHRIDPGCTRAFPFRSFAKGPLSEKRGLLTFAARQGFVYQLELIAPDAGPMPQVQFYDGDSPVPVPNAGEYFGNGLSVKTTGPGTMYLRASTCGF